MKPAPKLPPPFRSDISEARQALGHEPKTPVGVVISPAGFAEMASYGVRFPCPVAVDPKAPRETVTWFYLPENFAPFSNLIRT